MGSAEFKMGIEWEFNGQRHVRITFTYPEGKMGGFESVTETYNTHFGTSSPKERWPFQQPYPQFAPDNVTLITPHQPSKRLKAANKCIYCQATGVPLGEEHIIAEGLGGNLIIPLASCERCAARTCSIEERVLRGMLWAPRRVLGIRGKKRRKKYTGFPVTTIVNGEEYEFDLPIQDHPTFLILPLYRPAGLLENRHLALSGFYSVFGEQLNNEQKFRKLGFNKLRQPIIDLVLFNQMLTKIAHCYAVSIFGVDGFISCGHLFAVERIDKYHQAIGAFYYVGGGDTCFSASPYLHMIGWHLVNKDNLDWIVVDIRLFANRDGFSYHVVAGMLVPPQLSSAIAHANSLQRMRAEISSQLQSENFDFFQGLN